MGSKQTTVLEVGEPERWVAHVNLGIGEGSQERMCAPMSKWPRGT